MRRADAVFLAESVAIAALCGLVLLAGQAFEEALTRTQAWQCRPIPYEVGERPECVRVAAKEAP